MRGPAVAETQAAPSVMKRLPDRLSAFVAGVRVIASPAADLMLGVESWARPSAPW